MLDGLGDLYDPLGGCSCWVLNFITRAVWSLCSWCQSLAWIVGKKSDLPMVTTLDRFSKCSLGVEGIHFGDLRTGPLLFADDLVLLVSSGHNLHSPNLGPWS